MIKPTTNDGSIHYYDLIAKLRTGKELLLKRERYLSSDMSDMFESTKHNPPTDYVTIRIEDENRTIIRKLFFHRRAIIRGKIIEDLTFWTWTGNQRSFLCYYEIDKNNGLILRCEEPNNLSAIWYETDNPSEVGDENVKWMHEK